MTDIYLTDIDGGEEIQVVSKEHVYVKVSGWVRAYDEVEHSSEGSHYKGLVQYPPHRVMQIDGEVTHQSPHGRI